MKLTKEAKMELNSQIDNLYCDWVNTYVPRCDKIAVAFEKYGISFQDLILTTTNTFAFDFEAGNMYSELKLNSEDLTQEEIEDVYNLYENWIDFLNNALGS